VRELVRRRRRRGLAPVSDRAAARRLVDEVVTVPLTVQRDST